MTPRLLVFALATCLAGGVAAQDLGTTCQVASTYDLTVRPDSLVFERADAAPRSVRMQDGALLTDGRAVSLRPDEQDRVALFERNVRALVPKVKAIANDGVDLAARAVRDEAATAAPGAVGSGELDRVLNARVADIKRRIAASQKYARLAGGCDARLCAGDRVRCDAPSLPRTSAAKPWRWR